MRQVTTLLSEVTLTETCQRIKPSETICPATVATRDALWPEHRSAKAKMVAAPARGLSNLSLVNYETSHPVQRCRIEESRHQRYQQTNLEPQGGDKQHSQESISYDVRHMIDHS
jgi:hypothetical protein